MSPPPLVAIVDRVPVIPVVLADATEPSVTLARTLVESGLPVVEVTLRTPAALDAVKAIRAEVPGALVGTGTVLTPRHVEQSVAAGAMFMVSPGTTAALLGAAVVAPVPLLPGASTVSEMMVLAERGYSLLKFFPAEAAGGAAYLAALDSPLPHLRFCPTGGIDEAKAPAYFRLRNVACVGGSWMVRRDWIAAGNWDAVAAAKRAAALRN
jgi:2-dehydro-3-deoxyphosphogluconate aldolase/(4S)-4-hydroxy-2-oxoglutarate aldolase